MLYCLMIYQSLKKLFKLTDVKQFEVRKISYQCFVKLDHTKEFTTYAILGKEMSNYSQSQVETNYLSLA